MQRSEVFNAGAGILENEVARELARSDESTPCSNPRFLSISGSLRYPSDPSA